jgi:DNA-binding response OmpR family regulator
MSEPPARILVVEDEYLLADALADGLAALGVQVIGPVGGLAEALALAATAEIDGAVLDINLRGEMVFPLADALAARGVPYVFATGYGRESIPAHHQGAPTLSKPVDVAALKSLLETVR